MKLFFKPPVAQPAAQKERAGNGGRALQTVENIVGANPELARLFATFGYRPEAEAEAARLLAEMKSMIRAEITDFAAFRAALQEASKRRGVSPQWETGDERLLDAALAAGNDERAALAVLNRNPIYEQMPFVERVPMRRGGAIIWLTPVDHACILKRPSDPDRFSVLLDQLEALYHTPHPARNEMMRSAVIEAVVRLRRELKRERAYFPTSIRHLEERMDAWNRESLEPAANAALKALREIVEAAESVRAKCEGEPDMGEPEKTDLLQRLRQAAGRYLAQPRLRNAWLTNHLLETLLAAPMIEKTPKQNTPNGVLPAEDESPNRIAEMLRREVAGGSFDPAETARRLRALEERGWFVSSVAFSLLAQAAEPQKKYRNGRENTLEKELARRAGRREREL